MRDPMTLPPDALERATSARFGDVRRWRPIDPDPSDLVTVHRRLRGSRYRGLSRIVVGIDPAGPVVVETNVAQRITDPEATPALELPPPGTFAERFDRAVLDGFGISGPISPETVRALLYGDGDDLDAARRILDRSPILPATPTPRPTLSPILEAFAEGGRALLRDLGIRR